MHFRRWIRRTAGVRARCLFYGEPRCKARQPLRIIDLIRGDIRSCWTTPFALQLGNPLLEAEPLPPRRAASCSRNSLVEVKSRRSVVRLLMKRSCRLFFSVMKSPCGRESIPGSIPQAQFHCLQIALRFVIHRLISLRWRYAARKIENLRCLPRLRSPPRD